MEFTVPCPVDGPVDVTLEDIDSVVLREADRADITFVCPHCGSEITVTAIVPAFLLSAMEALAEDEDVELPQTFRVTSATLFDDTSESEAERVAVVTHDSEQDEAYCEYFRRQLDKVDSVEDALREMDERP